MGLPFCPVRLEARLQNAGERKRHPRRNHVLGAAILVALVSALAVAGPGPAPKVAHALTRQNIVLILTDDQRWDSLQYMPNVESLLVGRGVTFANAFDNDPLCCPTRSTILTGLTSGHNGVWNNGSDKGGPDSSGGFSAFVNNGDQSRQIFGWLHGAGYQTALIGKFLNGYNPPEASWILPGVDDWHAMTLKQLKGTPCNAGGYFGTCYSDSGVLVKHPDSEYSTTATGSEAVSFIQNADPSKPLFLYYAPRAPHSPTTPEPNYANACPSVTPIRPPSFGATIVNGPAYMEHRKSITSVKATKIDAHWTDDCRTLLSVDDQVGNIVNALSSTGRLSNTLIMFTSDNGLAFGEDRWLGKTVPYEPSIRVPVVVRDDAVIPWYRRGDSAAQDITSLDYTPTFLQAAGLSGSGLDGQSLFPLVGGGGYWRDQNAVLLEHGLGGSEDEGVPSYCGIRDPGYMYAQYSTGEEELYDLRADPFELVNVAAQWSYSRVLSQMRSEAHSLCSPTPPGFHWAH